MLTLVNLDSESLSRKCHTLLHFVTLLGHFGVSGPRRMITMTRWGDLFHTLLTLIYILSHLYQIQLTLYHELYHDVAYTIL
jgi:hypothetical protein